MSLYGNRIWSSPCKFVCTWSNTLCTQKIWRISELAFSVRPLFSMHRCRLRAWQLELLADWLRRSSVPAASVYSPEFNFITTRRCLDDLLQLALHYLQLAQFRLHCCLQMHCQPDHSANFSMTSSLEDRLQTFFSLSDKKTQRTSIGQTSNHADCSRSRKHWKKLSRRNALCVQFRGKLLRNENPVAVTSSKSY